MKSFISLFLASLVLVSTVGITISKHFCSSEISSATKTKSCVCSAMDNGCGSTEDTDVCCDTEKNFFQTDYDFAATEAETLNNKGAVLTVLVYKLALEFNYEATAAYKTYRPPITEKNIPVLFQSFLI